MTQALTDGVRARFHKCDSSSWRDGASTREAARAFEVSQVTAWRAKQQGAAL